MAIKTHKVTLSLDNPRVIQSGINVQSFDKQSIQISIELTKNDEVFQVPSDATIRISLLKLARQEQKIIVDVPNTNRESIDWIVPDYLDGYQGTVRVGVYLVSGAENVDLGYFTILSNVSDIDKMADEFTDNVFQGWEQIEADLNELNLTIAQTKLDLAEDMTQVNNAIANINAKNAQVDTLASNFADNVAIKQSDVTNKYNAFDTSVTTANQTIDDILALQPQFQSVLDETTGKDVISAPEVILARGGATTLRERLDSDKAEVTAQLAHIEEELPRKADKNEVLTETEVRSLIGNVADGTPLFAENIAEMTDTSRLYVNTEDGYVYVHNGSVFVSTNVLYQSTGIADGSVKTDKTDFFELGVNLYNRDKAIEGYTVSITTGNTSKHENYFVSEVIDVDGGEQYSFDKKNTPVSVRVQYFDGSNFTSGGGVTSPLTVPEGSNRLRISADISLINVFQLEKGNTITPLQPYKNNLCGQINVKDESLSDNIQKSLVTETVAKGKNLFNKNEANIGLILELDGSMIPSFANNFNTTQRISVDGEKYNALFISAQSATYSLLRAYVIRDINGNIIDASITHRTNGLQEVLSLPRNAEYVEISYSSDATNYQVEYETHSSYETFIPKTSVIKSIIPTSILEMGRYLINPFNHKKVVFNGDSITSGYNNQGGGPNWATIVANAFNMAGVNYGIGGSSISVKESDVALRNPIVLRFDEMDDDADLVIIAGGTNDWRYAQTPVGTFEDRTNHTFYGALHNLCRGLLEKYDSKKTKILFMTPIKRMTDANYVNADGDKLIKYVDIIIEVCGFYGIPVLDMFRNCPLNPSIPSQLEEYFAVNADDTPDENHPNSKGHAVMGDVVVGRLKQLA